MSFLKAEWRKLAIANYEVNPDLLKPYLPYGTELDLWEGKCYVSLVGFMFINTKLLGVKIPFHIDFEEVNLRFYVCRKTDSGIKRGVVFIKEIVPKPALTFVANTIYKENYETLKMGHLWEEKNDSFLVEYLWNSRNIWNTFKVITDNKPINVANGSEAEFITEHYWGYAKIGNHKTDEYEVKHPKWQQYLVKDYEISVDFEKCYGKEFDFLKNQKPNSVMLAEGSEISVENKKTFSLKSELNTLNN